MRRCCLAVALVAITAGGRGKRGGGHVTAAPAFAIKQIPPSPLPTTIHNNPNKQTQTNTYNSEITVVQFAIAYEYETSFRHKLFNLRKFADSTFTKTEEMTPAIWTGAQTISYDLELSAVTDSFYAGGRLYMEAGLTEDLRPAGGRVLTSNIFIDVDEHAVDPQPPLVSQTGRNVLIGVAVGVVVLCCCVGAFRVNKYLKEKED